MGISSGLRMVWGRPPRRVWWKLIKMSMYFQNVEEWRTPGRILAKCFRASTFPECFCVHNMLHSQDLIWGWQQKGNFYHYFTNEQPATLISWDHPRSQLESMRVGIEPGFWIPAWLPNRLVCTALSCTGEMLMKYLLVHGENGLEQWWGNHGPPLIFRWPMSQDWSSHFEI